MTSAARVLNTAKADADTQICLGGFHQKLPCLDIGWTNERHRASIRALLSVIRWEQFWAHPAKSPLFLTVLHLGMTA